jgi:hypothetical protein
MIQSYGLVPNDDPLTLIAVPPALNKYGLLQSAAFRHLVQPIHNLLQSRSPVLDMSRAAQICSGFTTKL